MSLGSDVTGLFPLGGPGHFPSGNDGQMNLSQEHGPHSSKWGKERAPARLGVLFPPVVSAVNSAWNLLFAHTVTF